MLVKICGVTTKEGRDAVVEAGADFIGFVFAESRRRISPDEAAEIAAGIPQSVKKVGVFVNESPEKIIAIAEKVNLDYIQLHGDEQSEIAEELPYKIIKAFPAKKENLEQMRTFPCDYLLVDTPSETLRGGSGETFDWSLLDGEGIKREKLILAGGLTPENVTDAIRAVKPAIVDVSSGVETLGKKDPNKIKKFIETAKGMRG